MGPLVYTSGSDARRRHGARARRLQWGRWFTPAEATRWLDMMLSPHVASMGPLVYTSGSAGLQAAGYWPAGCFNGAAGLHQRKPVQARRSGRTAEELQWGRWFTPAEASGAAGHPAQPVGASMGPLVYTSGSSASRPPTPPRSSGFNGAAGLHQRKPGHRPGRRRDRLAASMGPLVYTSGSPVPGTR